MVIWVNFPFLTPSFGPLNDPRIFHCHSLYLQTSHSSFPNILEESYHLFYSFVKKIRFFGGKLVIRTPFAVP